MATTRVPSTHEEMVQNERYHVMAMIALVHMAGGKLLVSKEDIEASYINGIGQLLSTHATAEGIYFECLPHDPALRADVLYQVVETPDEEPTAAIA